MFQKSASHVLADDILKNSIPNYVTVNGERQKMHTFTESFTPLVGTVWYKPSLFDIMDNYYEMFRVKNQENKLYLSFTKT